MEELLQRGIKEIIDEYPEVGKILDEHNIGCVPCSVGTCVLRDIVEIHNLSIEEEKEVLIQIAGAVYPGQEVKIPVIKRKEPPREGEVHLSPPLQKLVNEHKLIMRWIALVPRVIENIDLETKEGRDLVEKGIFFIRNYADKYHHAKEEDVLFKYFDENLDIIKVMKHDHEEARAHVRAMGEGLEDRDEAKVSKHLKGHSELLPEHIKKEDDILYPWMDRTFPDKIVGELFSTFNEIDKEFGDIPERFEKFISELEKKYYSEEVKK